MQCGLFDINKDIGQNEGGIPAIYYAGNALLYLLAWQQRYLSWADALDAIWQKKGYVCMGK